jgi:FkbM family methyltransferase
MEAAVDKTLSITQQDTSLGAMLVRSPGRAFWSVGIKPETKGIAYLLAEQAWFARMNPEGVVQPGQTVIDCGANIGTFTDFALERGASQVIAIEPEPRNVECLRRTFAAEISAGRVVIVPKAVWKQTETLTFLLGQNHATGSVVRQDGEGGKISVQADTLDNIVRDLGLSRVDYIKMDIEGAERQALLGAQGILKRDKPILRLDSYHLPDDMDVLPGIIRGARPDYSLICGPCSDNPNTEHAMVVPHVVYYR